MTDPLSDLFAHQEWADSAFWKAAAAHPGALEDPALRTRLHHIHSVQRAFLDVWHGRPRRPPPAESYPSIDALREDARRYYAELSDFLAKDAPARLEERLNVPWFPEPQRPITLAETMHQVVMHSQHHRAQNATRLRELGAIPPMTDYIVWVLDGRPKPLWQ
jgi:uncharacterized damage-inducible protein DinB